jgi:hypothetical protein
VADNIFTEFGEENDATDAKHSVITGGVQKAMNIRKHWNSDLDIKRWQQALTDSSRFDKLITDVRHRWHPDFGMDRAQLVQKHNALFRQRDDYDRKDDAKIAAAQLRDLQDKIKPKPKVKSGKRVEIKLFEGLSLFGSKERARASAVSEPMSPIMERRRSTQSLEVLQEDSETNNHCQEESLSFEKDSTMSASMDASPRESADGAALNATSMGFFPSLPSDARRRSRPAMESKVQLPKAQLPRTFTLLLYRNGERTQKCGEAVFFQRVPKDMKEVLRICGERCRPLIAPVEALLDSSLQPVKDVQDVRSGGIFLLKGKEALDPPASFFQRGQPHGVSMRHFTHFQRHSSSVPSLEPRGGTCKLDVPQESAEVIKSHLAQSTPAFHLPFVGGPPVSGRRSDSTSVQKEDSLRVTWTVDDSISWRLSYGGLVNNVKHHDYSSWKSALPLSSRSGRSDRMRSTR